VWEEELLLQLHLPDCTLSGIDMLPTSPTCSKNLQPSTENHSKPQMLNISGTTIYQLATYTYIKFQVSWVEPQIYLFWLRQHCHSRRAGMQA